MKNFREYFVRFSYWACGLKAEDLQSPLGLELRTEPIDDKVESIEETVLRLDEQLAYITVSRPSPAQLNMAVWGRRAERYSSW